MRQKQNKKKSPRIVHFTNAVDGAWNNMEIDTEILDWSWNKEVVAILVLKNDSFFSATLMLKTQKTCDDSAMIHVWLIVFVFSVSK